MLIVILGQPTEASALPREAYRCPPLLFPLPISPPSFEICTFSLKLGSVVKYKFLRRDTTLIYIPDDRHCSVNTPPTGFDGSLHSEKMGAGAWDSIRKEETWPPKWGGQGKVTNLNLTVTVHRAGPDLTMISFKHWTEEGRRQQQPPALVLASSRRNRGVKGWQLAGYDSLETDRAWAQIWVGRLIFAKDCLTSPLF